VPTSPFLILNGDVPLLATIHRANDDLADRQPAVIVTGSWLTVKEQMPDRYARALAERGYTAITFDFAGFGASGGSPRQAEIPGRKIADITEVARYVSTLSFVRPGAVGHLAICASAQYTLRAIADGAPINSFVSVAGWYHDTPSVEPF
jgi:dienelactone hydrolase